jgi:hypothetical protein
MRRILFILSFVLLGQVAYSQLTNSKSVEKSKEPKNETEVVQLKTVVNDIKSTDINKHETKLSYEDAVSKYGFPNQVKTNNPDKDYATYKVAKDLWIKNNPELYLLMQTPKNSNKSTLSSVSSDKKNENNTK